MTEVWLTSNRRILGLALVPATALAAVGALLVVKSAAAPVQLVGWVTAAFGALLVIGLALQMTRPRIAYRDGEVLFYLGARRPLAAPLDAVEAFFLGQGEAGLPRVDGREPETVNLVGRLSQRYPDLAHGEVKPALGRWCDHYVTIRGTWCEPLTTEVIRRLNRRLRELHDEAKARSQAGAAS